MTSVGPTRGAQETNGRIRFDAGGQFIGNDTLTYRICATNGICAEAVLHIDITAE